MLQLYSVLFFGMRPFQHFLQFLTIPQTLPQLVARLRFRYTGRSGGGIRQVARFFLTRFMCFCLWS